MSPATEQPSRSASLAERVVVLFLVAAVVSLAYVYFEVIPRRAPLEPLPFDVSNPMLDAAIGECVTLDTTPTQGGVACLDVRKPGVVLRPRGGPSRLGIYRGLKRQRPYLACAVRYPPPGKDCADAEGREEILLFGLNRFGMPLDMELTLDGITPRWVRKGGRDLFVYEAQLTQYGPAAGAWFVALHPGAPVTGAVLRRHVSERQMQQTLFTPAEGCR